MEHQQSTNVTDEASFFKAHKGKQVRIIFTDSGGSVAGKLLSVAQYTLLVRSEGRVDPVLVYKHSIRSVEPFGG